MTGFSYKGELLLTAGVQWSPSRNNTGKKKTSTVFRKKQLILL